MGKTGAGKSSLGNTLFTMSVFDINHSAKSGTSKCQAASVSINGKNVIFIDTPGVFDTKKTEEEMKPEILKCITECAPGPHVFLIVLKVEKFTEQEKAVVGRLTSYFSEEALKYTVVLFTHGDQLPEKSKIQDFVDHSEDLHDLVTKCGGRCHVVDNKYWRNDQQEEYRTNKFQVKELFDTIDRLIETNKGGYFSTEMLHAVQREIEKEEEQSSENLSPEEITLKAKIATVGKLINKAAGIKTSVLLRGLLGGVMKEEPWLGLGLGLTAALAAGNVQLTEDKVQD